MHVCSHCKEVKEPTEFYPNKQTKDGLDSWCKTCRSKASKAAYKKNPDAAKSRANKRREVLGEELLEYKRAYHKENKARLNKDKKEYYKNNKHIWKGWAEKNRERRKTCRRARIALKKQTDPVFRIMQTISRTILAAVKRGSFLKNSRTQELLGCSPEELSVHLGPRPEGNQHLDHICPVSQARSQEEFEKLQHYTNLRWLSAEENLHKSNTKTAEAEELCHRLLGREWVD